MTLPQQIIYFADPMCSWCWGFSPVVDAIQERFGEALPIRLVLGGLQAGTTRALDDDSKESIKEHWQHVHEATKQPFDYEFFDRKDFVYDTEPPSRAIVAMFQISKKGSLEALKYMHHAFYADNRDVTDRQILGDIAEELGHDRAAFEAAYDDEETIAGTQQGFDFARKIRVTGFPTLLAGDDEAGYRLVNVGYRPWSDIEGLIDGEAAES